tara:strand:- start:12921 stop:14093 length:1173 start_codon:yes stop_codon:yes gene_type:complete
MSFNFGGFLAGMSESIVDKIEAEEEQQRRFQYLAETESMRARAAKKAERDKKNAIMEELAGTMEALGINDKNIELALGQGIGASKLYIDAAKNNFGKTDFFDPNVMFEMAGPNATPEDVVNDMNAAGDAAAKTAEVPALSQTTLTQPTAPTATNNQKAAYLKAAFGKPPKEYASLDAAHASIVQKMMRTTDENELSQLKTQEEFILGKIALKQKDDEKKGKEPDNWMTAENVLLNSSRAFKDNLIQFGLKYDDISETIAGNLQGKGGLVSIARLRGANSLMTLNNAVPTADTKLTAHISSEINTAKSDLTTYAKRVAAAGRATDPESLTGGTKFDYNRFRGNVSNLAALEDIQYRLSDVVNFNGKLLVYVGANAPLDGVSASFPFYQVGS